MLLPELISKLQELEQAYTTEPLDWELAIYAVGVGSDHISISAHSKFQILQDAWEELETDD